MVTKKSMKEDTQLLITKNFFLNSLVQAFKTRLKSLLNH